MTSLVGFEALLRGIEVVCYGQPFYSGWGLTRDHVPVERRTRRLTLEELAAGALLRYPRYYSFQAQAFTSAERVVDSLSEARARAKHEQPGFQNWVARQLRRGVTLVKGVVGAP
jgi:capsular polysaccharide export protein